MKRTAALLWIIALCLGLLIYSLAQPGPEPDTVPGETEFQPVTQPQQTEPSVQASATENTEPSVTEPSTESSAPTTEPTLPSTEPPFPSSQVRIFNNDPTMAPLWQQIAADYSAKTGVEVILVAERQDATLLTLAQNELNADLCADLSGSAAYAQLSSWDLALTQGDAVYAIAAEVECFGLLCNESLMAQAAHTRKDIADFASLSAVVQNITAAGLHPFAGRERQGHFGAKLASLPVDFRPLIDLWISAYCADSQDDPSHLFANGETVFYLGSTDEFEVMSAIGVQNLSILPLYLGVEGEQSQSLCVAAKRYWCVSSQASPEDITATIDFLGDLVTAEGEKAAPVDRLQLLAPYRQAAYISNPLEQSLRDDVRSGKTLMVCRYLTEPPAGLPEALSAYAADQTEENWAAVEAALVP